MEAKEAVSGLLYRLSKASDREIPALLLTIETLLEEHDGKVIKALLWDNEILSTITDVIKQNFADLHLDWGLATQLCALLVKCCIGITHPPDFTSVFLPLVVDSFLELATNMQSLLEPVAAHFTQCLECVFWLVEYQPDLAVSVIESPRLLSLLMTDSNANLDISILKLLRIVLTQPTTYRSYSIEHEKLLVVFDEVMLKMTAHDSSIIQQVGADVILQTAKCNPAFHTILLENAEEVLELLGLINSAPGAHDNINSLLNLIEQLREDETKKVMLDSSATKIQSVYRGYAARRKLQLNSQKVGKFQLKFREWLQSKKANEQKDKEERLEKELNSNQARERRRTRLKEEARKLQYLPATQIPAYQHQVASAAASKIQSVWRMRSAKREVGIMREQRGRTRAAVTIQRAYRKYRSVAGSWGGMLPPGLTAEKVTVLQQKIQDLLKEAPAITDQDEVDKSIIKSQEMYLRYSKNLESTRRAEARRKALCRQLSDQVTHIKNAPTLEDCTEEDARQFSNLCSDPVILEQARKAHKRALAGLDGGVFENGCLTLPSKYDLISKNLLNMDMQYSPLTYKIRNLISEK